MEKVNALQMRQSLGRVLKKLERGGEPVLVEKARTPVAVLISLADYQKRFVDREADDARRKLVARIKATRLHMKQGMAADALASLRGGEP